MSADVMNMLKDQDAKYVDLRFCDTLGKEQHVTVPTHTINEDFFTEDKIITERYWPESGEIT